MRTLRSPAETPDFENLLTATGGGEPGSEQARGLPDPFAHASLATGQPHELQVGHSSPLPSPRLGPYRPYWRESMFLRAVNLELGRCVAALEEWAEQSGRGGVLHVGRSQILIPAGATGDSGRYLIGARLGRWAPWSLDVPMELELIPWSAAVATTWLALCPRRRVHLSRRYFRAGHALLDQ